MGQRTAILIKKNYKDNRSVINLIHHQWGIGKVMPMLFLQELMRVDYKLNRSYPTYAKGTEPIDHEFTFTPLSSEQNNYIYNKEVKTDEVDVFDIKTINEFFEQTDNNNGGMIIEITQKYDSSGNPEEYGDMFDVRVGFVLGSEECYWYNSYFNDSIEIEAPFSRLVSCEEFMFKTWGNNPKTRPSTKKMVTAWKNLLDIFGVQEVYDKESSEKITHRVNHIEQIAKIYTKGKKANGDLSIPQELLEAAQIYG